MTQDTAETTTAENTGASKQSTVNAFPSIPTLQRYALTLLMATPSHLRTIKDNDQLLGPFLTKSGVSAAQLLEFKTAIHNFDKDPTLSTKLQQIGDLLIDVLGSFYPTPPCPNEEDAAAIIKQLG